MIVNRKEVLDILQKVKPGLANKEVIEQTTGFIFYDGRVFTYNDEVAVSHPLDFKFEGSVTAKEFYELLDKMGDDEVDIEPGEDTLVVKGKRAKGGVKLYEQINEIILTALSKSPSEWYKLPMDFVSGVTFCSFSAGKDMNKFALTNIHCSDSIIVASDSYRITKRDIGGKFEKPMNIPASIVKDLKGYEPIEYAFTDCWVHLRNKNEVIFSFKVSDIDYPKDKAIGFIEIVTGDIVKLPTEMTDALNRAGIFSSDSTNNAMSQVEISITNGDVTIKGKNDHGWFEESMRVRYKGDPISFKVSHDMLRDILSLTDEVTIGKTSLKFQGEGFAHAICLID